MKPIENRYIKKPKFILPKDNKIIFESKLFRIYNYKQKLLNGKYTQFEIVKRQDNAQILLINKEKQKIILTKETQPQYTKKLIGIPGGNVEWDEKPKDGAIRETFEETGIKVNKVKLFATDSINSQKLFRNFYLYLGWGNGNYNPQNSPGEKIEILELDFNNFIKATQKKEFRNPTLKKIVKELKENKELNKFKKILFNDE